MSIQVALVIVSHSDQVAQGVTQMALEMAPGVTVLPAGGLDDGGLGTSFDKVEQAVRAGLSAVEPDGAVVLIPDIGSSVMIAESVLEEMDGDGRVAIVNAPLVEGGVAGAVAAQMGGGLSEVSAAALGQAASQNGSEKSGGSTMAGPSEPPVETVRSTSAGSAEEVPGADTIAQTALVTDPVGLHARPAAQLARLAGSFEGNIRVNGADARSVLELMALGVRQGQTVEVSAEGPQARVAVDAIVEMLEDSEQAVVQTS